MIFQLFTLNESKMKVKFLICVGFAFLMQACTGSDKVEVGNKTTMTVNLVYDAGKVIKGEIINAQFVLKNTGDYPLVIGEVKGSCSCTVAEKPEDPIMPGEEGIVKAYVTTESAHAGPINKSVSIVANTDPSRTEVVVSAKVVEK